MAKLMARDIAQHIKREDEPMSSAIDRVRTWVRLGLLKPAGKRHPGTGKHRQFTSTALREAVLLQTLIDTLGAPATVLTAIVKDVMETDTSPGYLWVFKKLRSRLGGFYTAHVPRNELPKHVGNDVSIVINVDHLWRGLPETTED